MNWALLTILVGAFSGCVIERPPVPEGMRTKWQRNCAGKSYSIAEVPAPGRPGHLAFRFELRAGEKWISRHGSATFRSEIDTNDNIPAGSAQWYGLSIYIPKDFPIEDRRLVIGQWYADSDPGEIARSPAMAQRFVNGRFYVTVRHSADRIQRLQGREEIVYQTSTLKLGEWNDLVYQVKWSYMPDGFVNMWLNGQQVASYRGAVGYNDAKGPVFQFGIYRDDSDKTYVIYIANYRRGMGLKEVDPRAYL